LAAGADAARREKSPSGRGRAQVGGTCLRRDVNREEGLPVADRKRGTWPPRWISLKKNRRRKGGKKGTARHVWPQAVKIATGKKDARPFKGSTASLEGAGGKGNSSPQLSWPAIRGMPIRGNFKLTGTGGGGEKNVQKKNI